jgi:hypothetical protein
MHVMIASYREENDDVEFKFIHVFAWIEISGKWAETPTALPMTNTA